MKVEWRIFLGLGAFVAPITALYWFTSYEHAGSAMMAFFVLAFLLIGAYLLVQARRSGPRPEDRTDATPADGAEDLGFFPSRSLWPFVLAVGAVVVALGLVFSGWLALPGVGLLAFATVGYAAEAQRPHG